MVLVCMLKWPGFEVLEGKSYQLNKWATAEVMKRPACFLGTCSMSHVQELSRNAQNSSSFLSCCLQNLPRSLTRALLPGPGEGWVFASGHHIQRSITVSQWAMESTVLLFSSLQPSVTITFAALREELAWVPDPSSCSCCAHRQRGQVSTGFLPEQPVQHKQLAGGWGMGKCWFGFAPSYSLNPLLTPPPISGCFPWSRHCFLTAPFQKELKETSSVAFSLVCAKTIS